MTSPADIDDDAVGLDPIEDPYDRRMARGAVGLLNTFNLAGVLWAADVHVAIRLGVLAGETDERVLLAVALAVRGVRAGSVCINLTHLAQLDVGVPWPDLDPWLEAVRASSLVGAGRPLRWDLGLLYLDRYWRQEEQVRADLDARAALPPPAVDEQKLLTGLDRLFPEPGDPRNAAEVAARGWTTVLGGGPGTGKTTTVARLLAVLADQAVSGDARVALAAPTGKAAARLQEAVLAAAADMRPDDAVRLRNLTASTLHRLLGSRPGESTRFRHHRDHKLPHDVIVVDEASMLSLTLMARLLEAVRPDARLILVGDPDQLASVEAGAVLADLMAGLSDRSDPLARPDGSGLPLSDRPARPSGPVVRLGRTWRFGGDIADLAEAVRTGNADRALEVATGPTQARLLDPDRALDEIRDVVVAAADGIRAAAEAGDAAQALAGMNAHRLLCAHRAGPSGVHTWTWRIERWLAQATTGVRGGEWYVGRPLLVTANDYALKLFNGDTGVVVRHLDGVVRAVFPRGADLVDFAPARLSDVQTVHAMSVHRSQGSQFDRVTVILPPADSELATREMLYTALTRAQTQVRLVGTHEQLVAMIRRPAARASGLRQRLTADRR